MTKHPKIEQKKDDSKDVGLKPARENIKTEKVLSANTDQKRKELTLKTFNSVYESHKHSR